MELGDHAYPEHLGIFSVPFMVALQFHIDLIVWGENPEREYGGTPAKNNQFMEGLFKDVAELPGDAVYNTPKPSDIESIFLGDYVKWNAKEQVKLVKRDGFRTAKGGVEWTFLDYENLDTKFVAIHDYFKWLKFGYGRATDQASIEIHQGRMTREQAMSYAKLYDGKLPTKYLKEFLEHMGITRDEFDKLVEEFRA